MRHLLTIASAAALLCGCYGTVPESGGVPIQGISAVLVGGRFLLPTGETREGLLAFDLEGEGGRRAELYRIPVRGKQSILYQVEPGIYRIAPSRGVFGGYKKDIKARIEGRTYTAPFPRDLLRHAALDIKPKKIIPLGIVEAKLSSVLPGQKPVLRVHLDDSVEARRQLIQAAIRDMMDPSRPMEARESAVGWSHALQTSLMELASEAERTRLYRPGP